MADHIIREFCDVIVYARLTELDIIWVWEYLSCNSAAGLSGDVLSLVSAIFDISIKQRIYSKGSCRCKWESRGSSKQDMGNTLLHTNFWSNRTIDSCFMYFRVLCFLLCSPFDEPDIVILVIENPSQASTLCFLEVKLGATSDCLCAWLIEKVAKLIGKVCTKGRYSSTFFCRCANPVGHFSRCPPAVSCRQVVGLG